MWSKFQSAVKQAWASSLIDAYDTAVIFYDLDRLDQILDTLNIAFKGRQSVAIKTCPIPAVLKRIVDKGFALEAASIEEVRLARSQKVGASHIIFDSPVKTRLEIAEVSTDPDILLNCNSLEELSRIPDDVQCAVGLRVNPLVDLNNAEGFNVSRAESKFGVPISQRDQIIEAFTTFQWLSSLHMHIGSGVGEIDHHVQAVRKLVDLSSEINTVRGTRGMPPLKQLDIGGGLKSSGDILKNIDLLKRYADALKQIPQIGQFNLITEFGQLIHEPNGFVLTKVEYVRQLGDVQQVFLHVGADLFTRNVYSDLGNNLSFLVLDESGELLSTKMQQTHLVGPLCFAGDEFTGRINLPEVKEGQFLIISSAVANTYGLWSRHCSRDVPKVLIYSSQNEHIAIGEERKQVW